MVHELPLELLFHRQICLDGLDDPQEVAFQEADSSCQAAVEVACTGDCVHNLDRVEVDLEVGPKVGDVACDDQLAELLPFASDRDNYSFSNSLTAKILWVIQQLMK